MQLPGRLRGSRMETKVKDGKDKLAFRELEALACALLAVLLSFMLASIASQKAEMLELASQLDIKFDQGTSNTQARRAGLPADSAAVGEDQYVETFCRFGGEQRLAHIGPSRLADKIIFKGSVIDGDLALCRDAGKPARLRSCGVPFPTVALTSLPLKSSSQ